MRPFVSEKLVSEIIRAVKRFSAATCAVGAVDTIVQADTGFIGQALRRDKLMAIQTPQAFSFKLIRQAHQAARAARIFNASDDAQLVFRLKKQVKLVPGSYKNIKITTKEDLRLLKR